MDKSILVVDDERRSLEALADALEEKGYAPVAVSFDEQPEGQFEIVKPELVFMSLASRRAFEVCDAIREIPDGAIVPIIFVGDAEPGDDVRSPSDALSYGGDYFFAQPLELSKVLAKVQTYVGPGVPRAELQAVPEPGPAPFDDDTTEADADAPLGALDTQPIRALPKMDLSDFDQLSSGDQLPPRDTPSNDDALDAQPVEQENDAPSPDDSLADASDELLAKINEQEAAMQAEIEARTRAEAEERRRKEEEDRKRREEEEERRRKEEEDRRRREEEEERRRQEEEDRKRREEEEERRRKEEEDRKRREEEEERRRKEEEDRKRREEEEERRRKEEEDRKRREEEEERRRKEEEDRKRREEEEERRRQEEEDRRRREEEEERRRKEEERIEREAEELRQREAEERRRRLEEERARREEEERKRREEEERERREEEERRREEAIRVANERREHLEEERLRQEREAQERAALRTAPPSEDRPLVDERIFEDAVPARELPGGLRPMQPERGVFDKSYDIATLLHDTWRRQVSGQIELSSHHHQKSLFFERGHPVDAFSSQVYDRMEEYLFRDGKITRAQYQEVRVKGLRSPRRIASYLVTEAYLKPAELFEVVRGHLESVLFSIFEFEEGEYRYVPQRAEEDDRVMLDLHPRALIVEGIRRKYTLPRLIERVGAPSSLLGPKEGTTIDVETLGFGPEERQVVRLVDGTRNVEDIVFSTGLGAQRVYHVLASLLATDTVEVLVRGIEGVNPDGTSAADDIDRSRIREKYEHVRNADYFHILGVSRRATPYEVERAFDRNRREFSHGRFSEAIRNELEEELQEIEQVLLDARDILSDESLRDAYARHLP